jgi:hypothetical protein
VRGRKLCGCRPTSIVTRLSAEGSRELVHQESGCESLLSRVADRLHAEVAGKADLERSLDNPPRGVGSSTLTQRKPAAQSREPLPHYPAHHFPRACTSTHTLQHALITFILAVTLRYPPLRTLLVRIRASKSYSQCEYGARYQRTCARAALLLHASLFISGPQNALLSRIPSGAKEYR